MKYVCESLSWFVCSLVEETKKDGFVDVTQAYNKIINSIKEAEEAAKMADRAANETLQVQKLPTRLALNCFFVRVRLVIFVCLCAEHKEPGPRPDRRFSEEPQSGAEGRS